MKKVKKTAKKALVRVIGAIAFLGIFTEPTPGYPIWKWLLWELGCLVTLGLIAPVFSRVSEE